MIRRSRFITACLVALSAGAAAQGVEHSALQPPPHTQPWPSIGSGEGKSAQAASLQLGPEMQRGISPQEVLRERRLLDAELDGIAAQRPGTVDAYVVTVALDSDPVFAREAREARRVLSRRYGANGRAITLAGPDGVTGDIRPKGSISALMYTLARLSEVMDPQEDVLVLYSTSHGIPQGLTYHYGDSGYGILSPQYFRDALTELGLQKRLLILSACFSGTFVPYLAGPDTAILTAAAFNRTSFGCEAENDWTYFGDAMINRALRKPHGLVLAAREASSDIAKWEGNKNLTPSLPQTLIGASAKEWLAVLEAQIPQDTTRPVGRPAVGE
ncbi:C13 family peptidase [Qipengyuania sp. DGS5-3]|uniref:C13 family peptidase n=1 Tax=Qipengyuania sp. DGS5-3 TaxID=3349632 RepID=UPI0036D2E7F2